MSVLLTYIYEPSLGVYNSGILDETSLHVFLTVFAGDTYKNQIYSHTLQHSVQHRQNKIYKQN